MSAMKKQVLINSTLVLFCILGYLLSYGHFFLPLPASSHFSNEKIETRGFHPFLVPQNTGLLWRLEYPGRARLIDASKEIHAKNNVQSGLQLTLEKLGYVFPPGCRADSGDYVPGWYITHYPSILDRIQKDFRLQLAFTEPSVTNRPMTK
jgi:hypothetical protein